MNEFITIKHDFSSEYIDMAIKRAKKSNEKKSQRNYRQKVSFEKKHNGESAFLAERNTHNEINKNYILYFFAYIICNVTVCLCIFAALP